MLSSPFDQTSSLCGREVTTGVVSHADQARIGYLTIGPPLSFTYEQNAQTYKSGFNHRGKIIGYNAKIPYPGELPKYHDIPFLRHVDWAGGADTNTTDHTPPCVRVTDCPDGITERPDTKDNVEIDEYFTADNDEGYNEWAARKSMTCEDEAMQSKRRQPRKSCLANAKKPTPVFAEHSRPVIFQTTNQMYGGYADLTPNYVSQNLMSTKREKGDQYKTPQTDNLPAMTGYMNAKRSSRTTCMDSFGLHDHMPLLGLRSKCHTFEVNSPTGLEMNRIPGTNRSLFATMVQQKLMTRPLRTPLGKVTPTNVIRVGVPACSIRPGKQRGMFKTTPGYMCLEKKVYIC